jgi:hypothetical protein
MDTQPSIRPFANGSQFADWTGCNCDRCTKGAHLLGPDDWPTCEIELALGEAYLGDGKVTADIARRMGQTEHEGRYVWPCGEANWTEEWKAEYLKRKAGQT